MNISRLLAEKKEKAKCIKETYGLLQKYRSVGLICIDDDLIIKNLREALSYLPGAFIIYSPSTEIESIGNIVITKKIPDDLIVGFDFVVGCDNMEGLQKYMELGVAPIVSFTHPIASLLGEFNPIKNEGNSFLFQELNTYCVFAAVTRYLENYKFSMDNKNLIRNILSI